MGVDAGPHWRDQGIHPYDQPEKSLATPDPSIISSLGSTTCSIEEREHVVRRKGVVHEPVRIQLYRATRNTLTDISCE